MSFDKDLEGTAPLESNRQTKETLYDTGNQADWTEGEVVGADKTTSHWRELLLGRHQSDILEATGVKPLEDSERTDIHFLNNFFLWMSMNATISCFSTGTLGPFLYGLSLRDSALTIVFTNLFSCFLPSVIAAFGPGLGVRTMIVARYSFGFYGAILPAMLNIVTFLGFCAVNAIVGGQVLSFVNPGHVSVTVGIVIVSVAALAVSIGGYRLLNITDQWMWVPIVFSFVLLAGFGGRGLDHATEYHPDPATAGQVLSFFSLVAGFTLSWGGCSADFNTYMRRDVSKTKVVALVFAGLYTPCVLIQVLGAAFAAAALSGAKSTWATAFADGSIGNIMSVALEPLHWFGKVLLVILALGIVANNAPTVYAFSLSLQVVLPFLARFPRYLLPLVATAIYLPVAIVGAYHFDTALQNFLGLIGYWAAIFISIVLLEHFVFRKGHFSRYDIKSWDQTLRLPPGIAAIVSSLIGAALVVLSMDQVWWRGPIARAITSGQEYGGDLAVELGMASSAVAYLLLRPFELKFFKR